MKLFAKRKLIAKREGEDPLKNYASVMEKKQVTLAQDDYSHSSSTTTHGATGANVGTTNTQTLTNKTLTTPVLTNPSVNSAGTITGLGTGANGIILKNLKNAVASALSGTQKDIEIDIGGVAYHFTVFPTKA